MRAATLTEQQASRVFGLESFDADSSRFCSLRSLQRNREQSGAQQLTDGIQSIGLVDGRKLGRFFSGSICHCACSETHT